MKTIFKILIVILCSTLCAAPTKNEFLKAVFYGDQATVLEGLKENGVEYTRLRDKEENTPLHLACCSKKGGDKTEIITLLLKYGAKVNEVNAHFSTPLHIAASNNQIEGVKILLKEPSIRVNTRNDSNLTPLLFATGNRLKELMKVLLSHGSIDPNIGTSDGVTPLHFAAMWGYVEEAEILLDNYLTNPDVKQLHGDFAGATPLHYAAMQAKTEIVELLLKHKGIDPNAKINSGLYEGFHPLHFAVMNPNTPQVFETVKHLISAGAKTHAQAGSGHLPSDLTTVKVIKEYLSDPDPRYTLQKKRR